MYVCMYVYIYIYTYIHLYIEREIWGLGRICIYRILYTILMLIMFIVII